MRPVAAPVEPLDVTVVLFDDGLSSTAIMPVEIFHSAGALWQTLHAQPEAPAFRVTTVSLDGATVRSPCGIDLTPAKAMADVTRSDIVIVPTSGLDWDGALARNSALLPWLRDQYEGGAYIAGACMGSGYLAAAGLLDGRVGTTHWAIADHFAERYAKVNWRPDLLVTEDARVLCSGGVYAAIDVSLYLVEKLCGHETAVQCSKALLLPMPRTHQTGYAMLPLSPPHDDDRIRQAETYIQASFREDVATEVLARQAGLGLRTFARRFKAATGRHPAAYLQAVRIETAKAMIERETQPIQAVSTAVGYDDVAFFRGLFKRATGMTPAEYRGHFGPMAVRRQA
ncbi:MAG: helix-turn-helix domain-containing protein [Proteobacteria bacterium]|nr:helix-turn-helix domain-containing protein [Pseudomonadota bacterium]